MEITSEDAKATLIRLQGQIDVWQNIYQAAVEAEKKKAADHADVSKA